MSLVEKKIKEILTEKNIPFEEFEHEAVYTCEQAAAVRGLGTAKEGIKSLIFGTETGKFILSSTPETERSIRRKFPDWKR